MNRDEALVLLKRYLCNDNLIKHSLAVEGAMRSMAKHFGEDQEQWGLAGLLHDIDYEQTKNNPSDHSLIGAEIILQNGIDIKIAEAIKTHNQMHGMEPQGLMAQALFCLDPLTGLIVASTLVLPTRKLSDLTVDSLGKRFQEKSFARGADRKIINQCHDRLGLELKEFMAIALSGMQDIASLLGL